MSWPQLEQALFARARHGMKLGLDRMRRALEALDSPHQAWPSVHVAGTNGKGSTCAFTERLFRESGLKTGLYTSPHLERFGERIRVSGNEISDSQLVHLHEELKRRVPWVLDDGPESLTFFELVTLMAFLHFANEGVDVVVAEVGLGGRLDATNVLHPLACAITPIGLDHAEYLGDCLSLIAAEKAGILKPGVPCVVAAQSADAIASIRQKAEQVGAEIELEGDAFLLKKHAEGLRWSSAAGTRDSISLGLEGPHQQSNAALALRLFEHACAQGLASPADDNVRRALSLTRWPGRFERMGGTPELVFDGAHNPQGAQALSTAIQSAFSGRKIRFVVGVLSDKSPEPMLDILAPLANAFIVTAPDSPRAMSAQTLAALVQNRHARVTVITDAADALDHALANTAPTEVVIACGSLHLIGEWRAHLQGTKASGPKELLRPADS